MILCEFFLFLFGAGRARSFSFVLMHVFVFCRSTRMLFTRMLTRLCTCTVTTGTNGQECVDAVLGNPPETPPRHFDVIFLDNSMPIMS